MPLFRVPATALLLAVATLALARSEHALAQGPPTPHPHTEADVRFMQDMIHHHAQALEMAGLVRVRTENEDVRRLAHRIALSQEDEIAMMRRWLHERGETAPEGDHAAHVHPHHGRHAGHDHHDHEAGHDDPHPPPHGHGHGHGHAGHAGMPGMLSPEQLAALAAASDAAFDRLFLEAMIFHHEGALTMVEELFAAEGAGQETAIFRFASHVDADQRAEILRMRRMLADLP